jgi:hypothetical protein
MEQKMSRTVGKFSYFYSRTHFPASFLRAKPGLMPDLKVVSVVPWVWRLIGLLSPGKRCALDPRQEPVI